MASTQSTDRVDCLCALEGATSTLHCNSCCFGAKYSDADDYPLIYSTGGVTGTLNPSGVDDHSYCVVHRLVMENGVLTAKLIQHIYVDMTNFESQGFTPNYGGGNFLVGDGYLYVFSSLWRTDGSEETHDVNNKFIVHKYAVPSTSESVITLNADNVISEYKFSYDTWFMQGGTVHDNIIYMTFGAGSTIGEASSKPRDNAIRAYDMIKGIEIAKIDGTILPYKAQEPEALAVYNDVLIANAGNGRLYMLSF